MRGAAGAGVVIIAVDIGTSKLAAVAWEPAAGAAVATRTAPNDADLPGRPAGRHEQDPARIAAACRELLRAALPAV